MFYVVADGIAYVMDNSDSTPYGAYVNDDGSIDWDSCFDFDPRMDEEDLEYSAHILYHLKEIALLTDEYNNKEVYFK